ncbi:MAG: hypothetical protein IPJ23_05860 [Ignavibacteriales bacterium]|nr:hypothetical protein [Ignavibacteriales bacterium]
MGVKPLYYYKTENVFLFASEIKALVAAGIEKKLSKVLMNILFLSMYPKTIHCLRMFTGCNRGILLHWI